MPLLSPGNGSVYFHSHFPLFLNLSEIFRIPTNLLVYFLNSVSKERFHLKTKHRIFRTIYILCYHCNRIYINFYLKIGYCEFSRIYLLKGVQPQICKIFNVIKNLMIQKYSNFLQTVEENLQ